MPILGIIASSTLVAAGDFESIATVTVGSGGAANVEFTSIPATYTHLQIRGIARSAITTSVDNLRVQFNSNTGANYANHELYGNGASAAAYAESGVTSNFIDGMASAFHSSSIFGAFVVDILDYTSTNKNKTLRVLSGADVNAINGYIILNSGLFFATPAAISSIKLFFNSGNILQYSHFALYGIKGA